MRPSLIWLPPLVTPMTIMIAMAWIPTATAQAPRLVSTSAPDQRLRSQVEHADPANPQPASILERLFARPGARDGREHGHGAVFMAGGAEIVAEVLQERMPAAHGGGRSRPFDRLSAAGVSAVWPAGHDDAVALGVAVGRRQRVSPAIVVDRKSVSSNEMVADCTWTHGANWRASLEWRVYRSAYPSAVSQMAELARGALRNEQGLHLTLAYMLAGVRTAQDAMIGMTARDARITADDFPASGSLKRRDVQAALFLSTAF